MRGSFVPENPLFVTTQVRQRISSFLASAIQMAFEDRLVSGFGMVTQVQAHFPELITFLNECVVSDVACRDAEINLENFFFHLSTLKVP